MEIYVLWNTKDNRLALVPVNYGMICAYLTKEQAQAQLDHDGSENRKIRKMILDDE